MKNIFINTLVLLICTFYVNISNAQNFKSHQSNKERITRHSNQKDNVKSLDFLKHKKLDNRVYQNKSIQFKRTERNKDFSKLIMLRPNKVNSSVTKTVVVRKKEKNKVSTTKNIKKIENE